MRTRDRLLGSALLAFLVAAPTAATGQALSPVPTWSETPRHFETFYTQLRLDPGAGLDRVRTDGVGARLMWNLPAAPDARTLASRTSVGFAAAYAEPHASPVTNTMYLGAESDVRLLAAPLAGRFDPFVTLGAGALHVRNRIPEMPMSPDADRQRLSFALTPGVGARMYLTRGVALRGDLRDLIAFDDGARHNYALGLGLSLTF